MNVRFACPECEAQHLVEPKGQEWRCHCGHAKTLRAPGFGDDQKLKCCAACGNAQLYRQKNFPQWLGLSLLAMACSAFFILSGLYMKELAWSILLGSAAFDLLLYILVGDVIVCYKCQARHYGLPKQKSYEPFELAIAEKYRQERLRRELAGK